MSNTLKKEMSKDFNKNKNYFEINSKIERVNKMKSSKLGYVLAPAFVLLIAFAVFISLNNKDLKQNIIIAENDNNLKVELNINKIKKLSQAKLDADVETIKMTELPIEFNFTKNIKVPNNLELKNSYTVYVRSDKNITKYDLLHDYVFTYGTADDKKEIIIAFSEIEKPLRDYYFHDTEKISKIGDIEIKITQYDYMYIATFAHNNIYFDIETSRITLDELVTLLTSLIS